MNKQFLKKYTKIMMSIPSERFLHKKVRNTFLDLHTVTSLWVHSDGVDIEFK